MHKRCAEFSAEICPYVNGKNRKFSDRPVGVPHSSLDHIQLRNVDGELFLYKIRKVVINGSQLLKAQRMLGRIRVEKSE